MLQKQFQQNLFRLLKDIVHVTGVLDEMDNFAFMLKTYVNDIEKVDRLYKSIKKYNRDEIKLYMVVPKNDVCSFMIYQSEICEIIAEENLGLELEDVNINVNGLSAGYINQQIIKLGFWESKHCENYLCLDSDAIFIRDFYIRDFMYDEHVPYTSLVEDNDLKCDPYYFEQYWEKREIYIKTIARYIGIDDRHLLTCHGFQILSGLVLSDLKEYFKEMGWTYREALHIAPYEFSWYNLWLQKKNNIPIKYCEPWFKTFHIVEQVSYATLYGITEDDLRRSYVGVIINKGDSFIADGIIGEKRNIWMCEKYKRSILRKLYLMSYRKSFRYLVCKMLGLKAAVDK